GDGATLDDGVGRPDGDRRSARVRLSQMVDEPYGSSPSTDGGLSAVAGDCDSGVLRAFSGRNGVRGGRGRLRSCRSSRSGRIDDQAAEVCVELDVALELAVTGWTGKNAVITVPDGSTTLLRQRIKPPRRSRMSLTVQRP